MADNKKMGRPAKAEGGLKPYAIRIEKELLTRLEEITDTERKRTGFHTITTSDIIRKVLTEYADNYNNQDK